MTGGYVPVECAGTLPPGSAPCPQPAGYWVGGVDLNVCVDHLAGAVEDARKIDPLFYVQIGRPEFTE